MIESLLLSLVGIMQGYILTRIDNLDSRIDSMEISLVSLRMRMDALMRRRRDRQDDNGQAE